MTTTEILANLLGVVQLAGQLGALATTLQAEGRDTTPEEDAALEAADASARAGLVAAIAKRRAGG